MNVLTQAQSAYSAVTTTVRTPRSIEYDAFSRITHRLKSANPKTDYPGYVQALHDNRNLWQILAIDVADPQNSLPQSLRAQIFYLAEFTAQHTSKIISGDSNVDVLVDINVAIMSGLRRQETAQ